MPKSKTPASGADGSTPKKRKQAYASKTLPRYFDGPEYDACEKMCGGRHSSAVLGPGCYLEIESNAKSSLPPGIVKARLVYPGVKFKAGHMLNACFGGLGDSSKNLVILTPSANSVCNTFDNAVKNGIFELKKLYEELGKLFVDTSKLEIGIKVDVTIKDERWGPKPPDRNIHTEMYMKSELQGALNLGALKATNGAAIIFTPGQRAAILKIYEEFKGYADNDVTVPNYKPAGLKPSLKALAKVKVPATLKKVKFKKALKFLGK